MMLANTTLKRLVNFHGHLCPELALGSKFCEYVQHLLRGNSLEGHPFSIIAENSTSALDAIQTLLGVTVGNQRLMVMDYGKHNYTLICQHLERGWTFRMTTLNFDDEEAFHNLENIILNEQALLEDIVSFQQLIDARVRHILRLPPNNLFMLEPARCVPSQPMETTSLYTHCTICGEQVLATRCIERDNNIVCLPCFQKEAPGCSQFAMQ